MDEERSDAVGLAQWSHNSSIKMRMNRMGMELNTEEIDAQKILYSTIISKNAVCIVYSKVCYINYSEFIRDNPASFNFIFFLFFSFLLSYHVNKYITNEFPHDKRQKSVQTWT